MTKITEDALAAMTMEELHEAHAVARKAVASEYDMRRNRLAKANLALLRGEIDYRTPAY